MNCAICNLTAASPKGLGQHISKTHKMSVDEYVAKAFQPKMCCHCGLVAKVLSISKGFDHWCAKCETERRKSSAIKMRAKLKDNPEKYEQFISKLSATIGWQWEHLDQSKRIENSLKNSKTGKWIGDVHSDDVERTMHYNNLKAPWSFEDLDNLFGI
jgi:hypothetical protein